MAGSGHERHVALQTVPDDPVALLVTALRSRSELRLPNVLRSGPDLSRELDLSLRIVLVRGSGPRQTDAGPSSGSGPRSRAQPTPAERRYFAPRRRCPSQRRLTYRRGVWRSASGCPRYPMPTSVTRQAPDGPRESLPARIRRLAPDSRPDPQRCARRICPRPMTPNGPGLNPPSGLVAAQSDPRDLPRAMAYS